eukprot:17618_1
MAAEEKKADDSHDTGPDYYNIFVVRHGERIDYVDRDWINKVKHNRYRDPHLAKKGIHQCKETAVRLTEIYQTYFGIKDKNKPFKLSEDNLVIIASPYIRSVQTGAQIAKHLNYKSTIKIEPGICEVLKEFPPHFLDNEDINKDDLCEKMIDVKNKTYEPFRTRESFKKREYGDGPCINRSCSVTKRIIDRYFSNKDCAKDIMLVGHGASCYGMVECLSGGCGDYIGLCCIAHFKLKYNGKVSKDKKELFKITPVCVGDSSHLSDQSNLRAF